MKFGQYIWSIAFILTVFEASAQGSEAEEKATDSVIVLDTEGNCFTTSGDNNDVVECTSEQAKSINQIIDKSVSPTVMANTIPVDKVTLNKEGRCTVISKHDNNVVDCSEDQSVALNLLVEQIDFLKNEANDRNILNEINMIVALGLPILIGVVTAVTLGAPFAIILFTGTSIIGISFFIALLLDTT